MPVWCPQLLFKFYLSIEFWLCWVFTGTGFSLAVVSGGCSGCGVWAPHGGGFSCGEWALGLWAQQLQLSGSRAHAQWLWRMSFVAVWHEGSSWTRG